MRQRRRSRFIIMSTTGGGKDVFWWVREYGDVSPNLFEPFISFFLEDRTIGPTMMVIISALSSGSTFPRTCCQLLNSFTSCLLIIAVCAFVLLQSVEAHQNMSSISRVNLRWAQQPCWWRCKCCCCYGCCCILHRHCPNRSASFSAEADERRKERTHWTRLRGAGKWDPLWKWKLRKWPRNWDSRNLKTCDDMKAWTRKSVIKLEGSQVRTQEKFQNGRRQNRNKIRNKAAKKLRKTETGSASNMLQCIQTSTSPTRKRMGTRDGGPWYHLAPCGSFKPMEALDGMGHYYSPFSFLPFTPM
jgi:hypothetical protein